jgi:Septum formation
MSDQVPPTGWQTPGPPAGPGAPDAPEPVPAPEPAATASDPAPPFGWQIPDPREDVGRHDPAPTGWLPPDGRGVDRTAVGLVLGGCMLLLAFVAAAIIGGLIVAGPRIADELRTIGARLESAAPSGTVSVFDLRPGDCFDEPSQSADTVDRLVTRDCAQPHGAEVISIERVPGGPTATFPGDDAVSRTAEDTCTGAFTTYVGVTPETSAFDFTYFTVTGDGWAAGDRSFDCIAISDEESTTSGSIRGSNR